MCARLAARPAAGLRPMGAAAPPLGCPAAHLMWCPAVPSPALPRLPQPPNVPVLEVQRMWLSSRQRNATDVTIVTQLSGAGGVAGRAMGAWGPACAAACSTALPGFPGNYATWRAVRLWPPPPLPCPAASLTRSFAHSLAYLSPSPLTAVDRLYMLEGQCGAWGSVIAAAVHVALVQGKVVSGEAPCRQLMVVAGHARAHQAHLLRGAGGTVRPALGGSSRNRRPCCPFPARQSCLSWLGGTWGRRWTSSPSSTSAWRSGAGGRALPFWCRRCCMGGEPPVG